MRHLITFIAGILSCLLLFGENNPYRSDLLWVTVPDKTDWIYQTGEKANVELQVFRYGIPLDNITVNYEIGPDMLDADTRGSITLKNGKAVIPMGTTRTPGFRDCRLTAEIGGRKYRHHVKVAFSPEKIQPYTRMPEDFASFWQEKKQESDAFPLTYTRKYVEAYSTDKISCYQIRLMLNKKGQSIYGYLFYPVNATPGSCPVVLCPPGAGIKEIKDPLRRKYYPENGFIRLEIEIHGLNPEMPTEAFQEITRAFNGTENGYLSNGLDNRDNYYMKRVYLACVKSIDLLSSLPEWDGKNIIVQGGSQGGALALVTAGLDQRVTACVANHPALSDMAAYQAGRAGGYPHFFRTPGMDTPDKLQTMAYYDVVNFSRLIRVPVFLTWGFNDDVCAPTTSYAVYNILSGPKEALITPVNEHWTSDETENAQLSWIKNQLR